MGNCCCCDFEDGHTQKTVSVTSASSTATASSSNLSSANSAPNPKLLELAEKTRRQLEKSLHVLIVSCATELGEEVLRIVYAEVYRAIDQISREFFAALYQQQSTSTTTQLLLFDDVHAFLHKVFVQAEKDSFIVVDNSKTSRRTQMEDYKLSKNEEEQKNAAAARKNVEDFRAGGGTFGDEVAVTTSLPGFYSKKKKLDKTNSKQHKVEEDAAAALAAFEKEMLGDMDDAAEDSMNGAKKGRILRIWEDSASIAKQVAFRPVYDRVQLMKIWLLGDRTYSGSLSIDAVVKLLETAGRLNSESNPPEYPSNTALLNSPGLLTMMTNNNTMTNFGQYSSSSSSVATTNQLHSRTSNRFSAAIASAANGGPAFSPALFPQLHIELADKLVTHLLRLSRRVLNPVSSFNFADLWVAYQEYGYWFPELDKFWDVASEQAKTRSKQAAEKMAAQWIEDAKKEKKRKKLEEKKRKLMLQGKRNVDIVMDDDEDENDENENENAGDDNDDEELAEFKKRRREIDENKKKSEGGGGQQDEDLQGSPEFLEALASLPENVLTKNDLMQFLLFVQKFSVSPPKPQTSSNNGSGATLTKTRQASFSSAKARKHAEYILDSTGGYCSKEAFIRYLTDPNLNHVLNTSAKDGVCHDMSLPITSYFISSSFKSFLVSEMAKNRASAMMYRRILHEGCRCVDLEIWEHQGKLVVYHGNNSDSGDNESGSSNNNNNNDMNNAASRLPLQQVLDIVNENAFTRSSYPLIVFLDIHVYNSNTQEALAKDLIKAFGSSLLKPTWSPGETPHGKIDLSPEGLVNKILLMSKRSQGMMTKRDNERAEALDPRAIVNRLHTPAFAGQTFDVKKNQERSKSGDAALLVPSILNLLVFDTVGGVIDLSKPVPPNVYPYHCTQIEEQKCLGSASRYQKQCIAVTDRQFVNVYPQSTRTNSTNFSAQHFWNAGIQFCSMNWQDGGLESRLYKKRFTLDNGNCGYLKKPNYMLQQHHSKNNNNQHHESSINSNSSNNILSSVEMNEQKKSLTLSFKLSIEFLSAIQVPTVCCITTGGVGQTPLRKIYRPVRDPYILAYVEGPFLEGQSTNQKKVLLRQPAMTLNESDEEHVLKNFSPQLMSQLRALANRNYMKNESDLRGMGGEGTHHPIFMDLVTSTLAAEIKRLTAGKRVYSTSSAATATNHLNAFIREPKNVLDINIPVPELSTLVIQLIDGSSISGGSPSSNSNSSSPWNSIPSSQTGFGNNNNNSSSSPSPPASLRNFHSTTSNNNNSATNFNNNNSSDESILNNKNKIIIAETFLPIHLIQNGVRCVPLHDSNSYPFLNDLSETRLMVKVEKENEKFLSSDVLFSDDPLYQLGKTYMEESEEDKTTYRRRKYGKDVVVVDEDGVEDDLLGDTFGDLAALLNGEKKLPSVGKSKDKDGNNNSVNNNKSFGGEDNDDFNNSSTTTKVVRKNRVSFARKKKKEENDDGKDNEDPLFDDDDYFADLKVEDTTTTTGSDEKKKKKSAGNDDTAAPPVIMGRTQYRRPRGNTTVDDFFDRITVAVNKEQPIISSSSNSNSNTTGDHTMGKQQDSADQKQELEKMIWGSSAAAFENRSDDDEDENIEDDPDVLKFFSDSANHDDPLLAPNSNSNKEGNQQQQLKSSSTTANHKNDSKGEVELAEQSYEQALLDFLGDDDMGI